MGTLLSIHAKDVPNANTIMQMQLTLVSLNRLAINRPADYLLAYESFKRLLENYQHQQVWNSSDWLTSITAIEKMLQNPNNKPGKQIEQSEKKLSDSYFHHLNDRK